MAHISLTRQARDDLSAIWLYIAEDKPHSADHTLDSLNKTIALLTENPQLGPVWHDVAPDFRYLVSGNYLILYREVGQDIEVVRVLHGARNLREIFQRNENS